MTPLERAERIADRILAKHYRGPQDSQGFVDLRPELRAGIVEELLPLLKPDRAKASAS
jgi:hypothetical protein